MIYSRHSFHNYSAQKNDPCLFSAGEAALRCGLGEKEDKLGSFTKKAMHIQLDRWDRRRCFAAGV